MKKSEQSKEAMIGAIIKLLENKDYQEITIKDIADTAGINRLTFYRNFQTKDDIVIWKLKKDYQEYIKTIDLKQVNTFTTAMSNCFEFWKKEVMQIELLKNNKYMYLIREVFMSIMKQMLQFVETGFEQNDVREECVLGGLYSGMIHWIEHDMEESSVDVCENIISVYDSSLIGQRIENKKSSWEPWFF